MTSLSVASMAVQLLYTSILFSLPLLFTRVYAQGTCDNAVYDRFYFPSSYIPPLHYNGDKLLVKYTLEDSGLASSLRMSLKCLPRPDRYPPSWALDVSEATAGMRFLLLPQSGDKVRQHVVVDSQSVYRAIYRYTLELFLLFFCRFRSSRKHTVPLPGLCTQCTNPFVWRGCDGSK